MFGRRMWKVTPKSWTAYLKSITSAQRFIRDRGGRMLVYKQLTPVRRAQLLARLREVDPEGLKVLQSFHHKETGRKRTERRLKLQSERDMARLAVETEAAELRKGIEEQIKREMVVAQEKFDGGNIIKYRFVQAANIQRIIAMLLACGYSKKEIMKDLEVTELAVDQVTPEEVGKMRKSFPLAIVEAADQKVMHDLAKGEIGKDTEAADRIAHRRRKLQLEAVKLTQDTVGKKMLDSAREQREKFYEDRWGVKRITEGKDEDHDGGQAPKVG